MFTFWVVFLFFGLNISVTEDVICFSCCVSGGPCRFALAAVHVRTHTHAFDTTVPPCYMQSASYTVRKCRRRPCRHLKKQENKRTNIVNVHRIHSKSTQTAQEPTGGVQELHLGFQVLEEFLRETPSPSRDAVSDQSCTPSF